MEEDLQSFCADSLISDLRYHESSQSIEIVALYDLWRDSAAQEFVVASPRRGLNLELCEIVAAERVFQRSMAISGQASLSIQIVVVGGSIAGLACAYALAKAGHRVRVLEQSGPGALDSVSHPRHSSAYPLILQFRVFEA